MMKKYLLLILFCLSVCSAYCQIAKIERYDDIDILTIADKRLIPLLDEVLETESRRDYYRTDSPFSIFFQTDSTILIGIVDCLFSFSKTASEDFYGMIQHGGHSFFVGGAYLDERIFHRSGAKRRVKFYTDSAYEENGKTVLLLFPDDSHSEWTYRYDGNEFHLLEFVDTSQPRK